MRPRRYFGRDQTMAPKFPSGITTYSEASTGKTSRICKAKSLRNDVANMKLAWSFILSLVVLTAIEGLVDVLDIAGSYPILVEVNDAWSRTSRGGNPLCFWASVVAVVAFAGVIGVATRPRDALLAVAFICANVVRDD